jgi:glutamate-1-semialdehyde aminotransferase
MLMQLSQAVQQSLGVEVLFRQMFEELTSPAALLDYLAERVPAGWGESAPPPPPAAPDSVGDPILARVDALARDLEALRRSLAGNGAARAVATFTPPAPPAPAAPLAPVVAGPWRPRGPERERSLSPRQERHLARLVERYVRRTAESKRLAQKNRAALADVRVSLGFRRLWKELVYPITVERSAGSRLWDVDDNEHIDLLMGFGVDLLGHSPPFVTAALAAQLARGVHLGPQSRLAGEVAERFCSLTGTERATFCNTGSEAVLIALRLARTVSRRDKIAFFRGAYHGLNDPVLAGLQGAGERRRVAPLAPGIPPAMVADSMVLELGDPEALAWIERHAGILGAVLVEPVQASRPTLVLPEFLRELRALTARLDIPLIFDEMITGFRAHPAGIQGLLGIQADLATYGKVVGGGMPIGLVGGRSRFLDAVDGGTWSFGDDSSPTAPQTYIAGTFSKHPLALAAALPVLEHLADRGPALQEDLNRRTADLVGELNGYFSGTGLPIRVEHFASLFQFVFAPELELSDLFQYHLLEHGVHLWGSRRCFLSTAHSDEDLRRIVAAVAASIGEMQEGELLPTPAAELRGPIPAAPAAAPRGPEPEALSLTENQRALWFLSQVGEEASRAYIEAQALRLAGPLDGEALARAWERVVGRHEALRARIAADGESQEILTEIPVVLPRIELADLPAPFGRREARRCLREIARRPFDLSRAPLWRLLLLRLDAREHLLALAFHHLIIDDWSLNVIFDELCRGYNAAVSGKADDLPPAASYRDYVRARTVPERQAADEAYWLDVFTPPPPALALPTDLPRPPLESFSGQREVRRLDAALLGELRRQSGRAQGTLLMSLLAGFALLLHRLTGEEDLVVGVPAAGPVRRIWW